MMKEAIFEAALRVLEEHGVGGMTMDRVAAAAGLAKGSLYNYFPGKQDCCNSFTRRIVEPLFQAIEEIAAADLPPAENSPPAAGELFRALGRHHGVLAAVRDENRREAIWSRRSRVARAACASNTWRPSSSRASTRVSFGHWTRCTWAACFMGCA